VVSSSAHPSSFFQQPVRWCFGLSFVQQRPSSMSTDLSIELLEDGELAVFDELSGLVQPLPTKNEPADDINDEQPESGKLEVGKSCAATQWNREVHHDLICIAPDGWCTLESNCKKQVGSSALERQEAPWQSSFGKCFASLQMHVVHHWVARS